MVVRLCVAHPTYCVVQSYDQRACWESCSIECKVDIRGSLRCWGLASCRFVVRVLRFQTLRANPMVLRTQQHQSRQITSFSTGADRAAA
jgi:hypothetical protein